MKRILLICFMLLSAIVTESWAQDRTVSGKVTDDTGEPIPGANIILKGTTTGTTSDIDGNWKMSVPSEGGVLVFTFVGMSLQEVEIGARSVLDVTLQPDAKELSEVVVQAYGVQSEKLNTQQVETVDSKSFQNFPIVSPQEALQGQAAGVQGTSSSGLLGSAQVVRVRGITSFTSGNSPLYVIDGVPLNDASGTTDGYSSNSGATALNPLMDLNPNDIESMTVLKDAAATSLYGSRGANGVILITTKKGKLGEKTQINFDYFTGTNQPTVEKDVLNFEEYSELRENLGADPASFPESGTDWRDIVSQNGKLSSYTISARGGSDKTTFYVGGTYYTSEAYVLGNEIEKLNGRLNLTHQANDYVKLGANFATSVLKNDRVSAENSTYSPWTVSFLNTPFAQAYDADGEVQQAGFNNPLILEEAYSFDLTSRRNTGNAYAEIKIIDGLTFKTDWGLDYVQVEEATRTKDVLTPGGSATKEIIQDSKWLTTNTLNFSRTFGKHTINALVGQSYETANRDEIYVYTQGFISDELPNSASGADKLDASNEWAGWAIYSWFGKLNYNLADKYIIEGNFRRDGSSRFGADVRYGDFGSVSASWLLSEEAFFPENNVLTFAKLTASYGSSGNDRISNYGSLGLYSGVNYNGSPGLYYSQPSNPNLTWETTYQYDINANLGFFNDRIKADVSFWNKRTEGILLDVPLPYTTGFPSRTQNFGEMENTGLDLTLRAEILNKGDLRWSSSFNIGFLNNEVTKLPESAQIDPDGNQYVPIASFTDEGRATVGKSANEFYLREYIGINPNTGDAEWADADGNPTTDYNSSRYIYAGSALPNANGGFTNVISYKGLSLSVFFNFVSGGKVYLADNEFAENIVASGAFNNVDRVLDSWTPDNTDAFAPAYSSSTLAFFDNESTRHLFDASYIRLKNITLAYQFPSSLLEKTRVLSSARIYVMGQNLATFASDVHDNGSDPEVNTSGTEAGSMSGESFFTSPNPKQVTFGVSLGF